MKKLLITGLNSYIGTSFADYIARTCPSEIAVEIIDMESGEWRQADFSQYDSVFHVAGIAHVDMKKSNEEQKDLYFRINTDLAVETAKKAKASGVKQFILMSSAIVYGDASPVGKEKMITADTVPEPTNCYGESKLRAERGIVPLRDESFKVVILRSPMIYGKGCKGNYPIMRKIALKAPFFPYVDNRHSMIYVENFCEFVRLMVTNEEDGLFFPQNKEYTNTSKMLSDIASQNHKKLKLVKGFTPLLKLLGHGSVLVNKAFGNFTYEQSMSGYKTDYCRYSLNDSLIEVEKKT